VMELAGEQIEKRAKTVAAIEEASENEAKARESLPHLDPEDVIESEATQATVAEGVKTQPSSISVSAPSNDAGAKRSNKRALVAVGVAFGAIAAIASAVYVGRHSAQTEGASVATSASGTPATSATTSASAQPTAVDSAIEIVTSATTATTPSPVATTTTTTTTAPPVTHAQPAASSTRCGLRTYFDSAGIKHYTSKCP